MSDDDNFLNPVERVLEDCRSGTDTRSDNDKKLSCERRAGADRNERNTIQATLRPANEQLVLFVRRLKRALANERGRDFFGVARGEYDFAIYPDVLRTVEWIESLVSSAGEKSPEPENSGKVTLRKSVPA